MLLTRISGLGIWSGERLAVCYRSQLMPIVNCIVERAGHGITRANHRLFLTAVRPMTPTLASSVIRDRPVLLSSIYPILQLIDNFAQEWNVAVFWEGTWLGQV
jgi:hypothetical protein